ncbi:MAG: DUF4230 domain-containing protein [Prevotella sp.]|nr:DUF4230 domain-containing protein [Prevotella sp.]
MKTWTKIYVTLGLVAVIVVTGIVWRLTDEVKDAKLEVVSDNKIDITPEVIQSIKSIGEWEFLSIADEEMVDTTRKGIFSDDHLVRIYYGQLSLGVNMHKVGPRWIEVAGDSVTVTLPKVELLDNDFIDEARTKSFYESGKWSAADREAMYRRAYSLMKRNCLTPKNIRAAQNNAEAQMQNIMKSLGFRAVTVKFDNNKHTQTQ